MNKFWKVMLAVVVGVLIVHVLYFLLFMMIGLSSISGGSTSDVSVKDNSVLRISLTADMPDKVTDGMDFDFMSMTTIKRLGLNDALKSIEKAKTDDRIKGIYLDMDGASAGTATIEELQIDNLEWCVILVVLYNFLQICFERLYRYVRLCFVKLDLFAFVYVKHLAYGKVDGIFYVVLYFRKIFFINSFANVILV